MSEIKNQPGIIDAADRIAREIIRTPGFKEKVRLLLGSLDPASAPGLVQTLMWTDPEFFLSIIGAAPQLLNIGILGGKELLKQLEEVPPALLGGLLAEFVNRLDGEAVGSAVDRGLALYRNLKNLEGEPLQEALIAFGKRVGVGLAGDGGSSAEALLSVLQPLLQKWIAHLAKEAAQEGSETDQLISALAGTISEAVRANPGFIEHVYRPLTEVFLGAAGGNTK